MRSVGNITKTSEAAKTHLISAKWSVAVKIPAYWSKATAEDVDREGKPTSFSCWRSSDKSSEDAHESALDAARRILRNFLDGGQRNRYGYAEAALREEVIQRFTNPQGELIAAVTQNTYGSLVLSTARVMFIDLDFPPIRPGEHLRYFIAKLFGRAGASPESQRESAVRARLEQFLSDHPQWSARVYRTCAGLRVLATHALFDPSADSTQSLLESLGTDPMYARLCKTQDSFRARLTPKPWRCGHTSSTIRWPRETDEQQRLFEKWKAAYVERQANFATCRFLGASGDDPVHPEVETIVEVHDRTTRCHEPLDLA